MVNCSSCGKIMELFQGTKVFVFQCLQCNLKIELPVSLEGDLNYNLISISEIPKMEISDILKVELQKRSKDLCLMDDMSLQIKLESLREMDILTKHLKRNEISFKTINDSFLVKIRSSELDKFFGFNIFSDEIEHKVQIYFRSVKFLKRYLNKLEEFLNYSYLNEKGRLVFETPNESIKFKIQRLLTISKIFFIKMEGNSFYLPWNSVLLLNSFITFPNELQSIILGFMIDKWQLSNIFHKSIQFEKEILQKQGKMLIEKDKVDENVVIEKKVIKPKKKRKITEFF